ncbi:MAG: UDP-N-acetylmuramoyl-tripeptide--D-alanyl-D-alanine ligase [Pseudomonadota bacterium]
MMRPLMLSELLEPLQAQLVGDDIQISGVTTDSRQIKDGDLFVALKGECFDGHDFLEKAAAAGASAALVSRDSEQSLSQLKVDDTQQALGLLGAHNRSMYQGPLVAITGSSGKTSVKNMLRSVFSQKGQTLATAGNFNNEIGVPLTLLELAPDVQYAVVEMGAGKAGDITWLCELGRPTVSVLLTVMPAHLETFGTVDDIASAKGEIFDGLGAGDHAVINADLPWAQRWRERAGAASVIDFARQKSAAITASEVQLLGLDGIRFTLQTPLGDMNVELKLPGEHNVINAMASTAVGIACGLDLTEIKAGLELVESTPGRLARSVAPSGAMVIDDCYNANPGSVRAAISALSGCEGQRTLILGAMRELGSTSASLHRDMGEAAREAGIEQFIGVGEELRGAVSAFGEGGIWFADCESAIDALVNEFGAGDVVLIKGSRGARMERVLQALLARNSEEKD